MLVLGGASAIVLGFSAVPGIWHVDGDQGVEASGMVRFADPPRPVPALTVTGLDGHAISSADWRENVTVVNFWATWCGPCLAEIPEFVALQEKYAGHVQFIGFSADEGSADEVRQFVRRHSMNYPVAIVGREIDAKFGDVPGLPTTFVIDRQGQIVQTHVGLVSPSVYEREIRALAGLPASPIDTDSGR